ncbi:hypothetical protein [Phyllobacterium endophyticum]|jgi:hypothetical protein|uniref:Uncharacterized protein n=1 Tax=Phyllobacterium endophyticum TaxID=1149773 RepID=A0A2P7B024_9HYPH|nr:hypothetical protein [Phyllobacterium endophyticum]MBB3235547.1 hypothetical protein [Phyllobacterium endophyticum]PSH59816.1 hypothetical protein CU100_03390 [Phyllobacterium endophyticum]TYR41965.1 hypothetical protein FY050_12000 [Phyllobacterium endophyticum]
MVGRKTHERQIEIIEGGLNPKDEVKPDVAERDLKQSKELREAYRKGGNLRAPEADEATSGDRPDVRGLNQESSHNKPRADD